MTNHGILGEMCGIVVEALNQRPLTVTERSWFNQELEDIDSNERRDWLRSYVEQRTLYLLHGILDMVSRLDACLMSRTASSISVTEEILLRSILEYAYKLTYLVDMGIDPHERIRRALVLFYGDWLAHNRLPQTLKSNLEATTFAPFLYTWHEDLTGKKLDHAVKPSNILDAVGQPAEGWPRDTEGNLVKQAHQNGYHIWSAIAHGNLWALRHYGMRYVEQAGGQRQLTPSSLDPKNVVAWQEIAGGLLEYSYGFSTQFLRHFDAATMNRLEERLHEIRQSIADIDSH